MKSFINTLLFLMFTITGIAQTLPNVQKESIWAPDDILINGNALEWNNQYQAHNKSTDINYTISNNDHFLYLIVQTVYPEICDKILRGGLTFTINSIGRKNIKEQISLTYPIYNRENPSDILNMFARMKNDRRDAKQKDILVNDLNAVLNKEIKLIQVKGIQGIPDEKISIYNEFGIKIAGQVDSQLRYTYELAIPIKYLKLPNMSQEFSYNIRLNGPAEISVPRGLGPPSTPVATTSTAPTDFLGKYVLAKK